MTASHRPQFLCPACGYNINPADSTGSFGCPECNRITSAQESNEDAHKARADSFERFCVKAILLFPSIVGTLIVMTMGSVLSGFPFAIALPWLIILNLVWTTIAPLVVFISRACQPRPIQSRVPARLILTFAAGAWVIFILTAFSSVALFW